MKWFLRTYIRLVERFVPSPFLIALLLSVVTFVMAVTLSDSNIAVGDKIVNTLVFWKMGFWELLSFSMQMVLILLLGNTLAVSPVASRLIRKLIKIPKDAAQATALIGFVAILLSFLNWGLCLVGGAILSRKMAERLSAENQRFNYGLLGAAGYAGMLAWHGGFSGSAPLKVAEQSHFLHSEIGSLPVSETILSDMNLFVGASLLLILPLVFYGLGRIFKGESTNKIAPIESSVKVNSGPEETGLENKSWPAIAFAIAIGLASIFYAKEQIENAQTVIDLNFINFLLFGSCILAHGNLHAFLNAVQDSIGSISGIIIQFPLYAGIMGIMKYSGLIVLLSDFFVSSSTAQSFPIITFLSAGIVNFFVPSGGGQWAVQGPILVNAASTLGIPYSKIIMAFAYGDGLTNMLQPFWALPLLGITKLKAKEILPFSFFALVAGGSIYILALLLF